MDELDKEFKSLKYSYQNTEVFGKVISVNKYGDITIQLTAAGVEILAKIEEAIKNEN